MINDNSSLDLSTISKVWSTKKEKLTFNGLIHTSAMQYSIKLSNGDVLSSYQFRNNHSNCAFIMWNKDGIVKSYMYVLGGDHTGSFSYDEETNTIYTEVKNVKNDTYYLGTLSYIPSKTVSYKDMNQWCQVSHYYRCSVDLNSNYWLGSDIDGDLVLCKLDDLIIGSFNPVQKLNLKDFGFKPLPLGVINDGSYNTMQASSLSYPYVFITSGDVNNEDARKVTCINLETEKIIFNYALSESDFNLSIPTIKGGHFEPEGVYLNDNDLMVGFNTSEISAYKKLKTYSSLYKISLK